MQRRNSSSTLSAAVEDEVMDLEDDGEDYVDDGDDEITAADSDAAELSWKDLKVTSPDGKTVLLYETCGRVKGRFLAIMGPSGAGKVHPPPPPT
jgi:ABC-type transport system involved in cytochrome bd biosynthesis fused ATPase/permease subunit